MTEKEKEYDRKKKYWNAQFELRKKADFWGDVWAGYVLLAGVYLIFDTVPSLGNLAVCIAAVWDYLAWVVESSSTFDFQFMLDMIRIDFIAREAAQPIITITIIGIAIGLWIKSDVMHKNVDWSVFKSGYYTDESR